MKTQKTILLALFAVAAITTSCRNSLYDDLPEEQTFNFKENPKQRISDTIVVIPPNGPQQTTQTTIPPTDTIRTGSYRINNTNNN